MTNTPDNSTPRERITQECPTIKITQTVPAVVIDDEPETPGLGEAPHSPATTSSELKTQEAPLATDEKQPGYNYKEDPITLISDGKGNIRAKICIRPNSRFH